MTDPARVSRPPGAPRDGRTRSVSLIVPTYREADSVGPLIRRVKEVAARRGLALEMLIVDDASDDGTAEAVAAEGEESWVRVVARRGPRSLSRSVLEGMRRATGDVLVVMDADLSHPPESIPDLVAALDDPGVDIAIGSRYVPGASIDGRWPASRALNSLIASALTTGLTSVRDPASGFFAIRRESFEQADTLNPIGYKIGLELLVKCRCRHPREVPIHFSERVYGKTKLRLAQRLEFLEHLRRLWWYRLSHHQPTGDAPPAGRVAAWLIFGAAALLAAVAVPRYFMADDPWLEAGRAIRATARAGDVVILVPGSRVDRLAAFDGLQAAAADAPVPPEAVARFARVFWVHDRDVPPPAGLIRTGSQRFGPITVDLLTRCEPGERTSQDAGAAAACDR